MNSASLFSPIGRQTPAGGAPNASSRAHDVSWPVFLAANLHRALWPGQRHDAGIYEREAYRLARGRRAPPIRETACQAGGAIQTSLQPSAIGGLAPPGNARGRVSSTVRSRPPFGQVDNGAARPPPFLPDGYQRGAGRASLGSPSLQLCRRSLKEGLAIELYTSSESFADPAGPESPNCCK